MVDRRSANAMFCCCEGQKSAKAVGGGGLFLDAGCGQAWVEGWWAALLLLLLLVFCRLRRLRKRNGVACVEMHGDAKDTKAVLVWHFMNICVYAEDEEDSRCGRRRCSSSRRRGKRGCDGFGCKSCAGVGRGVQYLNEGRFIPEEDAPEKKRARSCV